MDTARSAASEIEDIAKSVLCLVSRLQDARSINPAHAASLMSIIANRYRQAVESAPQHYLIAELPGNAALFKALSRNGVVDTNLYARLKDTVSRAIQSVFPDIARYAEGVDAALISASKFRREYDLLSSEIQFSVDTGRSASPEKAPMYGLREALVSGGVSARRLAPIAYEALHDLVFSHTLSEEDGEDFVTHSIHDAQESLSAATSLFGRSERTADVLRVTNVNLERFWSICGSQQEFAKAA